jgi:oligopeptide/dipeptide ABC transporter ATP-binding protein
VPVLATKNLTVDLLAPNGSLNVIRNVSLKVKNQDIVGLIGESGGGKSVFWRSLFGLLDSAKWQVSGQALLQGKALNYLDEEECRALRGQTVGIIPQDPMSSFDPVRTILSHFLETAGAHTDLTKKEIREMAQASLARLYIDNPKRILSSYPFQCSGGTLQRVMVAIADMLKPALLVADEPTTSVDVTVRREVLSLLKNSKDQSQTSILLISHDLKAVMSVASEINVMYAGSIIERIPTPALAAGQARHPYTIKLIKSRPSFSKERLESIPGSPPSLPERQSGCPFQPRCEKALDGCQDYALEPKQLNPGHEVRCLLV